nr:reverse transcriptase domain-containing protein [Tanacetum cinerariifolium]
MNFMVVKSMSPYNGIIGRPGLKAIQAVPSTVHRMLKFPVEGGIATIRSTILIPTECASVITSSVTPREERTRPANFTIALHPDFPDQEVVIGGSLSDKGCTELCSNTDLISGRDTPRERSILGYVITPEGIKPCLNKTAAVLRLPSPQTVKESDFRWTAEAEQAFQQLKQHLSELPLLVAPNPQEELIMYLSATYGAVSAVLMMKGGTTQTPIYFISRALQGPELNYSPMEKLVLSIVFAAKRLRRHFQAHPITVITDQPIKQVMTRLDVAGRLQKWSIMLGEHTITYRPRTSVKGQILADFLIEMPGDVPQAAPAAVAQEEPWTLFTDGSSCFAASNNKAEYEALVAGLRIATQMRVKNIQVNVDSKLVANQVLGTYVAKEDSMIKYLEIVRGLVSGFTTFSIGQVPRSKNKQADALSKIASTSFAHLSKQVLVEVLENKSIKEKEVAAVIEEDGPTWMTQIANYLKEGVLPGDNKEARKLRLKARQYELMEGVLYRRSFLTPWRRCPFPEGPGKVKFLIVAIDYFTKWVEAKAVATITGGQVKKFIWDNIVCRFGIPGQIISDNGKQFVDNPFKDWCDKLNITQRFALVKHPQFNGLVERANRSLREGIKARLGEGNKNWVEELPHVLWAHRTMIKSSHGDTPFSLTYRTEVVIPAEIRMTTYRTATVDVVNNDKELRLNLDLLERRERAVVCEAMAKSKMMKYYNARVCGVAFKPGDFVYRINDASHAVKERSRKGQNRIKTGQKREAWRSQKMLNAVTVERARKTEENKKRMNENAYTVKKLLRFKETRKEKGPNLQLLQSSSRGASSA